MLRSREDWRGRFLGVAFVGDGDGVGVVGGFGFEVGTGFVGDGVGVYMFIGVKVGVRGREC